MSKLPTEEQFLESVNEHKMEIINDDGVNRHIKFRKTDTHGMWFDIITWHGHLMINGDMGTYVFRRLDDMFMFFRTHPDYKKRNPDSQLSINTMYWSEKLIAVDQTNGYKEYDEERFRESVKYRFDQCFEDVTEEEKKEAWERVNWEVLSNSEIPQIGMLAAMDFRYEGRYPFQDFWESSIDSYVYQYIWCLYAINWAIQQYDEKAESLMEVAQ